MMTDSVAAGGAPIDGVRDIAELLEEARDPGARNR